MEITQIAEGYYNLLKSKAKLSKTDVEQLSKYRFEICASCPHFTKTNKCNQCGCNMNSKTRAKRAKCPIGKW